MEDTSDPVESSTSSQLGREVLRPIWQELQDEAIAKLEEISIEDLCRRARDSGVERGNQPIEVDFAI
jgi:DNA-binding IscR family transcriptional regulator